ASAAQLPNHLAVRMDRAGVAEMSCIARVGGKVRSRVRKARDAVRTRSGDGGAVRARTGRGINRGPSRAIPPGSW
ncbi:MAG: hypothetical protein KGI87_13390, partial [Burkholderiales bacterium]|nr:hypothetical protein [Burkholderiales bacterium]